MNSQIIDISIIIDGINNIIIKFVAHNVKNVFASKSRKGGNKLGEETENGEKVSFFTASDPMDGKK